LVRDLEASLDFESDESNRTVFLTERGFDRIEADLGCGPLHDDENHVLLNEVHQALHAWLLLRRDVDYIVRGDTIELVDEFTGRVADDRRWPDGLQAALEAKEGLTIRPGGRVLGSIPLQHFLALYPKLAGMTATARPAADELAEFYGLRVVVIPPNRPCVREDAPDVIFADRRTKRVALVEEIRRVHDTGRPILVGTGSVCESEELAAALRAAGVRCQVLNARNDEEEAAIVAGAGAIRTVTISTNMAGRGTDIRLGGSGEAERQEVAALGGLYVIGTNRHESRRIDDQLRGRAGRQGDPGCSRFFISLEDDLLLRFGIAEMLPARRRPRSRTAPLEYRSARRAIERLQGCVEAQNFEVRRSLWRCSVVVEHQRRLLQERRMEVLLGRETPELCARRAPQRHAELLERCGREPLIEVERQITLHHMDRGWEEHLGRVADLREGIHLVRIGGFRPFEEFHREIIRAFAELQKEIDLRIVASFERAKITPNGLDVEREGLHSPASTWTYLVQERSLSDLHEVLVGPGNYAFAAGAALTTGPLLAAWGLWRRWRRWRAGRE
jgi:preprotein translocase subunit SecA